MEFYPARIFWVLNTNLVLDVCIYRSLNILLAHITPHLSKSSSVSICTLQFPSQCWFTSAAAAAADNDTTLSLSDHHAAPPPSSVTPASHQPLSVKICPSNSHASKAYSGWRQGMSHAVRVVAVCLVAAFCGWKQQEMEQHCSGHMKGQSFCQSGWNQVFMCCSWLTCYPTLILILLW